MREGEIRGLGDVATALGTIRLDTVGGPRTKAWLDLRGKSETLPRSSLCRSEATIRAGRIAVGGVWPQVIEMACP